MIQREKDQIVQIKYMRPYDVYMKRQNYLSLISKFQKCLCTLKYKGQFLENQNRVFHWVNEHFEELYKLEI